MSEYLRILFLTALLSTPLINEVFAQACNCPPQNTCKPCAGSYTSLTLRYNGTSIAFVLIKDGPHVLANLTLSPLEEFTITGSKKNEKFATKKIPVLLNGWPNTILGPSCNEVKVGLTYGSFTVVAAESMSGSTVCCTSAPPDVISPVIHHVPDPITVQVPDGCSATVVWPEPTAVDNCKLKSLTSTHKPGDSFPLGKTTVSYTATDEAGLVATASFLINVVDHVAPVFSGGPDEDLIVNATGDCSASVGWIAPEIRDACAVSLTQSHQPNDKFPIGKTKVQYKAIDESGNMSTFAFNVIVADKTAPVFDSFPQDIVVAASECSARVTWENPKVSDACSGVTLTSSHSSGTEFPAGVSTVIFTATDDFGNAVERELTITVNDSRTLQLFGCPGDIQMTTEKNSMPSVLWIAPATAQLCEEVVLESTHQPGDLFSIGTTVVTYKATTRSGKVTQCTFNVTVDLEIKAIQPSKLLTPDGDGHNDTWIVANIDDYRDNQVLIFDRWGGIIFQANRYDNESVVWKGTNTSGTAVPTGTYFYTITANNGNERIHETGAVELVN